MQLISVIVPIYKVEKYLPKCIDSILAQTHTNFELLLIDDGSPDNCGKICDEYATKDSRIRVFHKENGGVSSARNVGLDNAQGEWVCFVDSDDWVSEDYLCIPEKFIDADVVQKSYCTYSEDGEQLLRKTEIKCDYNLVSFEEIAKFYVNNRVNALWDKIISRRIIGNQRFIVPVAIGEDFLFFLGCLERIEQYAFSSEGSYNYIVRQDSAMRKLNAKAQVKFAFDNIEDIKAITSNPKMVGVQNSIIYSTYINRLFGYRKSLIKQQRHLLQHLMSSISICDLTYLSAKDRAKLIVKKYIYYCGL